MKATEMAIVQAVRMERSPTTLFLNSTRLARMLYIRDCNKVVESGRLLIQANTIVAQCNKLRLQAYLKRRQLREIKNDACPQPATIDELEHDIEQLTHQVQHLVE